ncbi:hypothetical protein HYZ76_01670 [Candidatus Falkowbacteria bacterium]|nr:hypothetical protein [Candidatus Falkowbacteria bacterium]
MTSFIFSETSHILVALVFLAHLAGNIAALWSRFVDNKVDDTTFGRRQAPKIGMERVVETLLYILVGWMLYWGLWAFVKKTLSKTSTNNSRAAVSRPAEKKRSPYKYGVTNGVRGR